MKLTVSKALDEFVSTFKEWHYFVGGGAVGFVVGFVVALYVVIKFIRYRQQTSPIIEKKSHR